MTTANFEFLEALQQIARDKGIAVDTLLGPASDRTRTRVSVITLQGLTDTRARHQLVNQLVMALHSWIRAHPAADDRDVAATDVLAGVLAGAGAYGQAVVG